MLVQQSISKKKLRILLAVLIVAVVVMVYLIFYSFGGGGSVIIPPAPIVEQPTIETGFMTDFLNKQPYTQLRSNAQLPVQVGPHGRSNPFVSPLSQFEPDTTQE